MRATFAQINSSRIPQVLGICADSDELYSIVNEGMQRLIERGNWKGSIQPVRLCLEEGCVTLPRQILSLKAISLCDAAIPIRNQWWEYLPNGDGILKPDGCSSACAATCPGPQTLDRGFHPVFSELRGDEKKLRIYPTITGDVGKRILIQGYDSNGDYIRTLDNGIYIDGIWITLAEPFVDSPFEIQSITGVQKEETDGDVLLYELDVPSGSERLIGRYEPSETVAEYHRYLIYGMDAGAGTCCPSETTKTIMALAKLDFIPVSKPTDYLFIDNIPAIKEICQSIRYSEMDNPGAQAKAVVHERRAIRELNHQKQNLNGNDQTAVKIQTQGSAQFWKKSIGRMI